MWKTTYSSRSFRTAAFLAVASLPLYVFWILLGALSEGRVVSTVAFFLSLGLTVFVIYRTMGERVETHPEGIVIVNLFKTHYIRWEEINDIHVACREVVKTLPNGQMEPPVEEWGTMVASDPKYMLFDMWAGPQEIRAMWVSLHNGDMLFIQAADRNVLDTLLASYRHVRTMNASDFLE